MNQPSEQLTALLLIRPAAFGYNPETAVNNAFQKNTVIAEATSQALLEFDGLVQQLQAADIPVVVLQDPPEPVTSDAVFPNNWLSTHADGTIVTYPMFAPSRRLERHPAHLAALENQFILRRHVQLEKWEEEGQYLEGTGSLILDRENRLAYACESPRTDRAVLEDFCREMGYVAVLFRAKDPTGMPIYHTNVILTLGPDYVIICKEIIPPEDWARLEAHFAASGKRLVPIRFEQVQQFAGNMLAVQNRSGEPHLLMSTTAYQSLSPTQLRELRAKATLLHAHIPTIEQLGGGSVRCMLAEVFLRPKTTE